MGSGVIGTCYLKEDGSLFWAEFARPACIIPSTWTLQVGEKKPPVSKDSFLPLSPSPSLLWRLVPEHNNYLSFWEQIRLPHCTQGKWILQSSYNPLNNSPKRRVARYEEVLHALSVPGIRKKQTFPTPSLKGRAASSSRIENPGIPPPHTLYSEAAATFPYLWLITEKICSPRRRKATLSDKRQATAQLSARKGIQAVPREHALSSGHCRHRASCSRSLYLTLDEHCCCCFQEPVGYQQQGW